MADVPVSVDRQAEPPAIPGYQSRRIKPQVACTITVENKKFIEEVLIPGNPKKFPGGVKGNMSAAINACIEVVRKIVEK